MWKEGNVLLKDEKNSSVLSLWGQFIGMQNRPLAYALAGVVTLVITVAMWIKVKNSVK